MTEVFQLYRLQQVDNQINQNQSRIKAIEVILNDDNTLRKIEKIAADSLASLLTLQAELKNVEAEVEAQRLKIQQNIQALYGGKVRHPKELQDLQSEGQALERHLATLEDKQIEIMIPVEETSSQHNSDQAAVLEFQSRFTEHSIQLKDEQSLIQSDLIRLEGERQAIIGSISSRYMVHYEELRQKRGGVAVALVNDKTCTACGTTLSATLIHSARASTQLTHCESCGRILYVD
jgi:predicted  nucleic acid-binding Zn-ribbon protein